MGKPVLLVGDANADLIVQLPPQPGNRGPVTPPELRLGGTVANTAVALSALGVPAQFAGALGDDGYGRFVSHALTTRGVDASRVVFTGEAFTTVVLVIVERTGERTLFGWPRRGGAHGRLPASALDAALVGSAAWLHSTGMCFTEPQTRETIIGAMTQARAAGVPVSLDLNLRIGFRDGQFEDGFLDALERAVAQSDYVLGSAVDEIAYLRTGADDVARARALAGERRTVISRRGAEGATAVSANDVWHASPPAVRVLNSVGAGDAFDAGFIAALVEGQSLSDALRWGNAAAALKISSAEGMPPTRAELLALLASGTAEARA
ncbi:MAG: sugar kinase [Chloroflexi bacterium]|nr:sugar kinase [Chloroflexota bacterium]